MINAIPPPGVIMRDNRGYVICHICGRAYARLGSHARESHGLTIAEYKEMFGLCSRSKTTEKDYSERMRELAYKYKMPEMLKITGEKTRIKNGETDKRRGKTVRLQESIDKKNRKKNIRT